MDLFSTEPTVEEVHNMSISTKVWFNITLEQYLRYTRGPKHLPSTIVIPLTIIYSIIFLTGIFGNVTVCIVIYKNKYLQTPTNLYLVNLAIADLLLLIFGLPNDLSVFWQQYPFVFGVAVCKFRAVISEMTSYVSVLTIVAFSMERYLAICKPLYHHKMAGLKRAFRVICAIWIIAFIFAVPFAIYTNVNYVEFPPGSGNVVLESAFCALMNSDIPRFLPIFQISCVQFFVTPLLILIYLYLMMISTIRNDHPLELALAFTNADKREKSKTKVVRMLMAVVAAFFICWAPFHAQRLLYVYLSTWYYYPAVNEWLFYIGGIMYFISATINPILYHLMSTNYRNAFFKTICCRKPRLRQRPSNRDTEELTFERERKRRTVSGRRRNNSDNAPANFRAAEPDIIAEINNEVDNRLMIKSSNQRIDSLKLKYRLKSGEEETMI